MSERQKTGQVKANGMPFTLPFSPDTIRWRRAASSNYASSASTCSTKGEKRRYIPSAALPWLPGTFWMYHANIDRLWWEWQQGHAGENPNLTGTGASSPVMDPWSYTEPQTRDITALGYEYV